MIQTVNFHDFVDAFEKVRPNNFSYEGLGQIFEYLESYEEDTGEQFDLDVIAICCDYSEETPEDIATNYDIDLEGVDDEDIQQYVMNALARETTVIGYTDDTIIYQVY
jgi:secreted PhoX family phosphatase